MTDQLRDKFRGVLLGMACGDALGAQVEFMSRGTFPDQRDMTGGGPHKLRPGEWTDDTAMALLLGEHLLVDPHVENPKLLAKRWNDWREHGVGSCTGECFDVGVQTSTSLRAWKRAGKAPIMAPDVRGNGALMRVAPVALAHAAGGDALAFAAMRQARVTHPETCGHLCSTFATLLMWAMGHKSPALFQNTLTKVAPEIAGRTREQVDSSGYDVATYEAALWAVLRAGSLEEAVILAVNLGNDADTVGAVAGALAGAVWGASGIPSRWLKPLAWGPRILGLADEFYNRSQTCGGLSA